MFTNLERNAYAVLVVLALCVAVVLASPAPAQAQAASTAEDTQGARANASANLSHAVVRPGDSLWSISGERLGPDATPRQVMNGAERIHALNRARIGPDPDRIFVGQELSVPRAMSGPPTGETTPAREAAEASEAGPRDRASRGPAGKEAPRTAPGQGTIPCSELSPEGVIPCSELSLEEAVEKFGADTVSKEALPDPRAAAPVLAARMVASNDAKPSSVVPFLRTVRDGFESAAPALAESVFGAPADARWEGQRRLLGLGIWMLTPVVAALVAAYVRGGARREARKREIWFRETYGGPYAVSDPSASHENGSRWASEVRGRTAASSAGPTNTGAAPEDRSDHVDLFSVARAKRAQVRRKRPLGLRRQPLRPRVRGSRQPVRARSQTRPSSGRRRAAPRARRKEWEPGAALVGALGGLPLRPEADQGENLAGLKPLLGKALGAVERLERQRGLSEREKTRREALRTLVASTKRG